MDSAPPGSVGALLEAFGELIIVLDNAGTVTYASDHAAPSFLTGGRSRDRVLGRVLWDEVPELRGGKLHAAWMSVATSRQPTSFEHYSALLDRWFLVRVRHIGDAVALLARDIREDKRALALLKASERRLREALVAARIGVWEWDIPNDVVTWNATQNSLRGSHMGETRQTYREFLDHVYPPDRARIDDAVRRAMLSGSVYAAESRSVDARGAVRHYASRGDFVYDDQGRPIRMYGVTWDVTAHKVVEQQQRTLADIALRLGDFTDFDAMLRNLAGMMVPEQTDAAMLFLLDEQGIARQVAAVHADPLKTPFLDELGSVYSSEMEAGDSVAARALATGRPAILPPLAKHAHPADTAARERFITACQLLEPASALMLPLPAGGRTIGALVLGMSAASRRQFSPEDLPRFAELASRAGAALGNATRFRALSRAQQAGSSFLTVLSHELRTPLNSVIGYAHLLSDELFGPLNPLQSDRVRRLRMASDHMLHLVQQILDFAELEAGRAHVNVERVSVDALAEEAASLVEPLARQKGLALHVQHDAHRHIVTDPLKVRQILVNLLANAVKFTERGSVTLRTALADDAALFDVLDTGRGVAASHLTHMFDPFWRAPSAPPGTAPGTGLGLALARELAHFLGGELSVTSVEGKGSIFTLRLPLASPQSLARRAVEGSATLA